jgi:hypothetical protein
LQDEEQRNEDKQLQERANEEPEGIAEDEKNRHYRAMWFALLNLL